MDGSENSLQKLLQRAEYGNSKEAACLMDSVAIAEKDKKGKVELPCATCVI